MASLNDRQSRAFIAYQSAVAKAGIPALPSPVSRPDADALAAFVADARAQAARVSASLDAELASLQAPRPPTEDDAPWKRLDEACKRCEQEFRSSSSLGMRMTEGRRSMTPKVAALVDESLVPHVEESSGRLVARIDVVGLEALQQALPGWGEAWARYVCSWVDHDFHRAMAEAWTPREGDLPFPPPRFDPLQARPLKSEITFPALSRDREALKLGSGLYRHARSFLYGLMSLTVLFGVNLRGSGSGTGTAVAGGAATGTEPWQNVLLGLGVLAAVAIGYVQLQAEREKERARLSEELQKEASNIVHRTIDWWMERTADRLAEDVRAQLADRRTAFVSWYRSQVVPAIARREREAVARVEHQRRASSVSSRIQDQQRELKRVIDELGKLAETVGG